jgi:hypothetical protein
MSDLPIVGRKRVRDDEDDYNEDHAPKIKDWEADQEKYMRKLELITLLNKKLQGLIIGRTGQAATLEWWSAQGGNLNCKLDNGRTLKQSAALWGIKDCKNLLIIPKYSEKRYILSSLIFGSCWHTGHIIDIEDFEKTKKAISKIVVENLPTVVELHGGSSSSKRARLE